LTFRRNQQFQKVARNINRRLVFEIAYDALEEYFQVYDKLACSFLFKVKIEGLSHNTKTFIINQKEAQLTQDYA
jgi:hypothetical protein